MRERLYELEHAVHAAQRDRRGQAQVIEQELSQLHAIYRQMSSDLEGLRAERDEALQEAQAERERRARETLELSEKLDAALYDEDGLGGATSAEGFVRARLEAALPEHRPLAEGEMPAVPGYHVVAALGRGGMGAVYHAVRERDGREVAVKLMHDGADASPGRTELFLREAAVMLQLSHPGLVRAFDAGDSPHGRYLVLELIRGECLSECVQRDGPLSEKHAIRVGLQVARALAYCARLGLTHRDVKPSNLLADATGRVRLCDFGLATLPCGAVAEDAYGSPGYAAPEQISDPAAIDERVDIYGLGATLWHLVVGRRPFYGPATQVFAAQQSQDLSDPRFEGADISPRLAQVIRRMGRADRRRRYARWDECILDLMLVENGSPPFSAHLADALDPGAPGPAGPDVAPDSAPVPAPASQTEAFERVAPPRAAPVATPEPQRVRPSVPVPEVAPARVPWFLVLGLCLVGAAVGYGAGELTQPQTTSEMETRARRTAAEGDPQGAAKSLRAAASLFDGADRAYLLRAAASIESGVTPPK